MRKHIACQKVRLRKSKTKSITRPIFMQGIVQWVQEWAWA